MNPLLKQPLADNSHFIPFPDIKDEHYAPALDAGIARTKENLIKIAAAPATFKDIVEGIEFHKEDLERVSLVFFNLLSAHTNEKMQALAKEYSPKLAELANDLLLNPEIFARVKEVYEKRESLGLVGEQKPLLEKLYKAFRRNGANLSATEKDKLREIDKRLSVITQEFSDNVLKATNDYVLFVTNEAALAELPAGSLEEAKAVATEKGRPEAWAFTLQAPSFIPFMQFCNDASLRKELWLAVMSKGMKAPYDNRSLVKEIASLRHRRAALLGYETHAHFVLEERMADKPERVKSFLEELLTHSRPAAEKDLEELRVSRARTKAEGDLSPWDVAYFSEKLRREKYNLSQEELRPYFQLENVIEGVFEHARRLYGIKFKERKDIPVYHPDVRAFEVNDAATNALVGYFYADFFPRASKKGGAWMTNFLEQGTWGSPQGPQLCRPHVSIVCNFTKPTASQPSLLTLDEVRTTFHEFGHALHSLLTDCKYASLSGTNVFWDFVELPSQMMENWVNEQEALALFAKHYQTGEVIPASLVEKIRNSSNFQAGWMSMRQISFGFLDLAWHSQDPADVEDIEAFERAQTGRTMFFPPVAGTSSSAAFSHIFAGGYSAGYYSYKWAEVLDADAFEFFKEKGIFSPEVAQAFKSHVLSKGGTEHPMELYKKFRGREPDPKALLRRDGLIE
ncbi:MAG: M3 family peptidase [Proteobacteria bacterium]|nr:MAG: M3 family peptidase [Pseudomonadota bacterium]